ncbi:MAG: hypothetical protein GF418_12360 [Chitinivibrionales bacterium]|nr:hypothetical protein [Chitinivibrionales bacterium]MBD3396412.1 hypothetical protein [Chitinivibrionales bacterium]
MSKRLRQYLFEHYSVNGYGTLKKVRKDFPIQIDDQDDTDSFTEFCNIFVTVGQGNNIEIEFSGGIPITREIADFAEIYKGRAEPDRNRVVLTITPSQIEALTDLAARIKNTTELGHSVGNENWDKVAARTVSSLYRFVRVIREYQDLRNAGLL